MGRPIGLLAFVLACASSAIVSRAQSPEALPKPGPEVQKLAVLVGKFTNEGETKAGAFGPNSPAMKIKGTDECRWTADGFGLLCTETIDIGGRKETETDVIFYDPISKKYENHGITNVGETNNQTGTVSGNTWTWVGQGSLGEKVFHTRYVMKFVSKASYEYTEDWAEGDQPMKPGTSGKDTRIVEMSSAAGQSKLSSDQQEVIEAHEARTEASNKRDEAAYSRFVADDCIFSTDDGDVTTKAQLMANVGKLPTGYDHTVNPRDYVVHVYGDTAVLSLRYTTHEQFTDANIISEQRATETYIKRNGSWLLIARHWGNLPVNFRKPVAVDTSAYKDYVGKYVWRPLDQPETVSVKDGKLWTDFGEGMDEEYFPLGSETFFVKTDLGSVTFVRDAQGHVTGYTYHRWDGQEIHAKKIK